VFDSDGSQRISGHSVYLTSLIEPWPEFHVTNKSESRARTMLIARKVDQSSTATYIILSSLMTRPTSFRSIIYTLCHNLSPVQKILCPQVLNNRNFHPHTFRAGIYQMAINVSKFMRTNSLHLNGDWNVNFNLAEFTEYTYNTMYGGDCPRPSIGCAGFTSAINCTRTSN